MSTAVISTIIGVVLAAFLAGLGFLIRAVLNSIKELNNVVTGRQDKMDNKIDGIDSRVTILEVRTEDNKNLGRQVTTLGENQAVMLKEMENHQAWHREQTLLARQRREGT